MRAARSGLSPWECRNSMMSRTARCSRQAARDARGEAAADALDLAQPLRPALDHLEHLIAERRDQLPWRAPGRCP